MPATPGRRVDHAVRRFDHTPTPTEPHALTASTVRAVLGGMTIVRERTWDQPFGHGVSEQRGQTDGRRQPIPAGPQAGA
jgi:hypothetical protein